MNLRKRIITTIIGLSALLLAGCSIREYKEETSFPDMQSEEATGTFEEPEPENVDEQQEDTEPENGDKQQETLTSDKESGEEAEQKEKEQNREDTNMDEDAGDTTGAILIDASDIGLTDVDGSGQTYTFTYGGEVFTAVYSTPENWKIYDSYRINSEHDLLIICQALIDEHPIHGKDMVSYRTAEDMVYEWQIHNIAYAFLDDDDPLKADSRDVDLDPKDQGLTIEEIYKSRTDRDFDMGSILEGY